MTPEQIERNRQFIKDLRANEKKAINSMRNSDGGRCCLCVALDTACDLGFDSGYEKECYKNYPPGHIAKFYGWPTANPIISGISNAANVNDRPESTHAQIADMFEETFPEIKVVV